jgi:hypothetical protein
MHGWMKVMKISMERTSMHPVSKLNSQGRVRLSLLKYGNQRGLAKPLKKEFKELANILVDGYRGSSFSISLAAFVDLFFPFLVVG